MRCVYCNRQTEKCLCKKLAVLNGRWPRGTWMQRRLQMLRIARATETRTQAGSAALRVICLLTILGALGFAGAILPSILRQIWANFHAVLECIDALTKC